MRENKNGSERREGRCIEIVFEFPTLGRKSEKTFIASFFRAKSKKEESTDEEKKTVLCMDFSSNAPV